MPTIRVETSPFSYPVVVGSGFLRKSRGKLPPELRNRSFVIISDETVWGLHGPGLKTGLVPGRAEAILTVTPGEGAKSMAEANRLLTAMLQAGCDRKTCVVAFGGGVVGDLAGFVAATFMRGVDLIQIPTTLLAMVDSSVGGKVAVNHRLGKNVIGAFHQPRAVLADLELLETLPSRQRTAGAVEAVKYGLLGDSRLLKHCLSRPLADWDMPRVVAASVRAKAAVVAQDEKEAGPRRRLNLGHTLGHALESATRYRRYLHGEAVALGTLYAFRLAIGLGRASESDYECVARLYRTMGVPLQLPRTPFRRLLELMRHDKKASRGRLLFIVPVGLGVVEERIDVPDRVLQEAYEDLKSRIEGGTPE